jgi:hypothetical protein
MNRGDKPPDTQAVIMRSGVNISVAVIFNVKLGLKKKSKVKCFFAFGIQAKWYQKNQEKEYKVNGSLD